MPNRYFNNAIDLINNTRARASDVEANFDQLEDGFDAAQVDIDAKANSVDSALSGTPTAPTAAPGTNTSQIATTAFVHAERDNAATLTNKTINLANNTLVATSAQLAAALADETGSGQAVFNTSPSLGGAPTAPTAPAGTSTTQLATTAFVGGAIVDERSAVATLTNKTLIGPAIDGGTLNNVIVNGNAAIATQRFSGNGVTTTFNLLSNPGNENNTQIYINGVYQQKDTYSVSDVTVTFSEAPPTGTDNIEVVWISAQNVGYTSANFVAYQPAGLGAATDVESALRALGDPDNGYAQGSKTYRTAGGAVRQTTAGGGWSFVIDAAHAPWGWDASTPVYTSGNDLVVEYDFTALDVGTFSVTCDESYPSIGLSVGASVGASSATISGYAPISGRIVAGTSGIQFNTTSGNVTTQVVDQAAGTIVITHPSQSHSDAAGTAVKVTQSTAAVALAAQFIVTTHTKTGFTLQYVTSLTCRIACTTATPGSEVFAVSETATTGISAAWDNVNQCVVVTFPAVSNNRPDAYVMLSRDAPTRYMVTLDTQASTSCQIHFYDTSGTKITAATTSMIFYFSKQSLFPAAIPSGSTFLGTVQRDMVPVNFGNLNGPSSNLWLSYAHPASVIA